MSEPQPLVYLDSSALGRIFDDHTQTRVRLEAEAVFAILEYVQSSVLGLVQSQVLTGEISANPNNSVRTALIALLEMQGTDLPVDLDFVSIRSEELRNRGVSALDSLHVATAEFLQAAFVTCDDRLIRSLERIGCAVWVGTPLAFCDRDEFR